MAGNAAFPPQPLSPDEQTSRTTEHGRIVIGILRLVPSDPVLPDLRLPQIPNWAIPRKVGGGGVPCRCESSEIPPACVGTGDSPPPTVLNLGVLVKASGGPEWSARWFLGLSASAAMEQTAISTSGLPDGGSWREIACGYTCLSGLVRCGFGSGSTVLFGSLLLCTVCTARSAAR